MLAPVHAVQHRTVLLFWCHLILFWCPEAEREALMRLVQAHTDDVEVNNMIKSAAEKGLPFNDPPLPNPNNNN